MKEKEKNKIPKRNEYYKNAILCDVISMWFFIRLFEATVSCMQRKKKEEKKKNDTMNETAKKQLQMKIRIKNFFIHSNFYIFCSLLNANSCCSAQFKLKYMLSYGCQLFKVVQVTCHSVREERKNIHRIKWEIVYHLNRFFFLFCFFFSYLCDDLLMWM